MIKWLLALLLAAPVWAQEGWFAADELYVLDGDSGRSTRYDFRLCGINAPEYDRPHFWRSRGLLKELLADGDFLFRTVDVDKYGRRVVVIFAADDAGESVNEKMARAGAAWHFKRYSAGCAPWLTPRELQRAEDEARAARRGLFSRE